MEGIVAIEGALMCENGLIEDTASAFFSEMHGHQVRNCWLPSTQGFLAYFTFARHRDAAHLRAEFCGRDTILRPEHDPDRGRWLHQNSPKNTAIPNLTYLPENVSPLVLFFKTMHFVHLSGKWMPRKAREDYRERDEAHGVISSRRYALHAPTSLCFPLKMPTSASRFPA
jgi:hypothetical protein